MAKGIKIVLIVSLLLNLGLIIGFWSFHRFVKSQMFKSVVMTIEAEENLSKNILSVLESGDSRKITELKERLQGNIEKVQKTKAIWQQAAIK